MKETGICAHFQTFRLQLESNQRFVLGTWKICGLYLDREMFLLSMLLVLTFYKQVANLIIHYHLAKIVYGYTQGQITWLLFGDSVLTWISMLPFPQIMAGNMKIRD